MCLLMWWLSLLLVSLLLVHIYSQPQSLVDKYGGDQAHNVGQGGGGRKWFHAAVILVYVPGLVLHPALLHLASSAALALLTFTEVCTCIT